MWPAFFAACIQEEKANRENRDPHIRRPAAHTETPGTTTGTTTRRGSWINKLPRPPTWPLRDHRGVTRYKHYPNTNTTPGSSAKGATPSKVVRSF